MYFIDKVYETIFASVKNLQVMSFCIYPYNEVLLMLMVITIYCNLTLSVANYLFIVYYFVLSFVYGMIYRFMLQSTSEICQNLMAKKEANEEKIKAQEVYYI